MSKKARVIAFYLPQFHPIPENDKWWGKGFTEWTNVAKAKPLFKGHYQPKVPADLGFYDLRMAEVREAQAEMAREAGIEGFCYWHYWFGNGKQLLERPFNEVLESGKPDFPFCLAWANHSWSNRTWDITNSSCLPSILVEQKYLGEKDYIDHFFSVLNAFKDSRYLKVDGKPLFAIFNPLGFGEVSFFIEIWRRLAVENGLKDIHFVGLTSNASFREVGDYKSGKIRFPDLNDAGKRYQYIFDLGFDSVCSDGKTRAQIMTNGLKKSIIGIAFDKIFKKTIMNKFDQRQINQFLYVDEDKWDNVYPCIIPNWDRTPRNKNAEVFVNSTPEVFKENIRAALKLLDIKPEEHKILFLKSWNEWGEGNYVEPDLKYGKGYLDILRREI